MVTKKELTFVERVWGMKVNSIFFVELPYLYVSFNPSPSSISTPLAPLPSSPFGFIYYVEKI